ncbi:Pimeloyl-ACP methyl ester carboxylesterase [Balamuthia mandrillaris]
MASLRPSEEMCSRAPGSFFQCSYGRVHYRLLGSAERALPLVVCLHGISAEGAAYLPLVQDHLLPLGFQCLLPDFYGRGWSDSADKHVHNDVHLFTSQLAELLLGVAPLTAHQSVTSIYLIGSSMGGAIATRFTHLHPELVKKLVLVCPAGLPMPSNALHTMVIKVPGMGEALLSMASKKSIAEAASRSYFDVAGREGAKQHLERTLKRGEELAKHHPMSIKSLINTVRNFNFGGLTESFRAVGENERVKVLLVWGDKDVVVPFENHAKCLEVMKREVTFVKLEDAGHVDMFAVPHIQEIFHRAVVEHFQKDEEAQEDKDGKGKGKEQGPTAP